MLITTCTHCLARFRVTPQQLNLKQGQVRCGHCQKVFSGFEALERFPDDDTGTRILAARAAAVGTPHGAPEAEPHKAPFASIPLDQLPEIQDEAVAVPNPESVPDALPPEDSADETIPEPVDEPVPEPASPPPLPRRPRISAVNLMPEEFEEPREPLPRAWTFGCALLGLALSLEVLFAARAHVAQSYPVTRPWLESVCAAVGCRVPWVNDPQLLKLEDSELLEVPGKPGEIALGARVRNLATHAQEFPHLELTLTDLTGQAAARRVLRPADYLGRAPTPGDVMAAGSEVAIQLRLETARIRPTGYELLLFYP